MQRVVDVYRQTPQPCVVLVESNQGGELIGGMINQVAPDVPVSYVHASRSKEVRADPIVLAYRMGRVWHKPGLEALQEQQTTWIPGISKESPGKIDALVWALYGLLIDSKVLKTYGRVHTVSSVVDIRTFSAKRSPILSDISASTLSRRPGLRPPVRVRATASE